MRLCRRDAAFAVVICLVATAGGCSSRRLPPGPAADPAKAPPHAPESVERAEPPLPREPAVPTPPAATPVVVHDESDCAAIGDAGEPIATVALRHPVDPANAPHPTNDGERLLFRQVYETLVRADCHGHVAPGLAIAWRIDADGRTWILTLRDAARFSDGTPVTAGDVRASWAQGSADAALRPRISRLVESVVAMDDKTIAITLHSRRHDSPIALAHTDLAIARPAAGSVWALGTRADRSSVRRDDPTGGSPRTIVVDRPNLPHVTFLIAPGDPRDLLDRGVDLLVTDDAAALAYAATLPQLQALPLPWTRTLALIAPGRLRPNAALSVEARHALAKDAVRGEARGAAGPFWWESVSDCAIRPPQVRPPMPFTPRVVYDAGDGAARDLAERLVGLARASNTSAVLLDVLLPDRPARSYQRASAMSGDALLRARRLGNDAAYVTAIDTRPLDPCRDLQSLTETMPWLDPAAIVALVDTRTRAIVKRDRAGLAVEWDGVLRLAGAGGQR